MPFSTINSCHTLLAIGYRIRRHIGMLERWGVLHGIQPTFEWASWACETAGNTWISWGEALVYFRIVLLLVDFIVSGVLRLHILETKRTILLIMDHNLLFSSCTDSDICFATCGSNRTLSASSLAISKVGIVIVISRLHRIPHGNISSRCKRDTNLSSTQFWSIEETVIISVPILPLIQASHFTDICHMDRILSENGSLYRNNTILTWLDSLIISLFQLILISYGFPVKTLNFFHAYFIELFELGRLPLDLLHLM